MAYSSLTHFLYNSFKTVLAIKIVSDSIDDVGRKRSVILG